MFRRLRGTLGRGRWVVGAVLLTGLALTSTLFAWTRAVARRDFANAFQVHGAAQNGLLLSYLNARLVFLDDLGRHLALTERPDPAAFRSFVAGERSRVHGIQALEWAPLVSAAERRRLEAAPGGLGPGCPLITERAGDGRLRPAQVRPSHFPVLFLDPQAGNEAARGFDLGSNPARLAAIEAARDSGQPRATEPLTLVQERTAQAGFLVFMPVYRAGLPAATVAERRLAFRGVVLGVFRAGDLVAAALGGNPDPGLRGELADLGAGRRQLHAWGGTTAARPALADRLLLAGAPVLDTPLSFAGRAWAIRYRPTPAFVAENLAGFPGYVIPLGALLTALVAAIIHLINHQKERAEALVRERSRELEESLARLSVREDDLRLLLDSTAEAIYGIDLEGLCTFCNASLLRMLGFADDAAVIGRNMHDLIHHTHNDGSPFAVEDCRIFKAFQCGQGTYVDDEVIWRADGSAVEVEYWSFPQRREGRITGAVVTFIDISARLKAHAELEAIKDELEERVAERTQELLTVARNLEREMEHRLFAQVQLMHAQKLESVGRLAAGVAHEINTPLQYLSLNMRFLQQTYGQLLAAVGPGADLDLAWIEEETGKVLGDSMDGIEQVVKIVRAMKEFSHPGSPDPLPVDLNHSLDSAATISRNEWKYVARLSLDLAPGLPTIQGYPAELLQVFLNLIINAAQAIAAKAEPGGAMGEIAISTEAGPGGVTVRIRDSGTGIAPEHRDKVFDPFFTTKEIGVGTGQGLMVSYQTVVNLHGGRIHFETAPGAGTTFIVELPLRVAPARTEVQAQEFA